ncbi:MAG: alanine racemase [Acidobacteriota bacterium]
MPIPHPHRPAAAARQRPRSLGGVPTPALVLDLDILERNLERMASRVAAGGAALRPHFKTHKCAAVADLQKASGAAGFTVSTLPEMRRLLDAGYDDILWAYPIILNRAREIAEVLRRAPKARLGWVIDSRDALTTLETEVAAAEAVPAEALPLGVWLKVDCGYHRAGVEPESDQAMDLMRQLAASERLELRGLLSHSGHSYGAPGRERLRAVHLEERRVMTAFAGRARAAGLEIPAVSIGSTPTLSSIDAQRGDLAGITEARPGNYVFYDYTQVALGACGVEDCALTVVASVISCRESSENCVIDAGALTLSKDAGPEWLTPTTFGEIFSDYASARLNPEIRVVGLSQEHGKVNAPLPVGTRLRILPNHSCLVVPNFRRYVVARGEEIVDFWPISHRTSEPLPNR